MCCTLRVPCGEPEFVEQYRVAEALIPLLFLVRSLDVGGAETQLVALASRLQQLEFDVSVATFYAGGALEDVLIDRGVRLVPTHKKGR